MIRPPSSDLGLEGTPRAEPAPAPTAVGTMMGRLVTPIPPQEGHLPDEARLTPLDIERSSHSGSDLNIDDLSGNAAQAYSDSDDEDEDPWSELACVFHSQGSNAPKSDIERFIRTFQNAGFLIPEEVAGQLNTIHHLRPLGDKFEFILQYISNPPERKSLG